MMRLVPITFMLEGRWVLPNELLLALCAIATELGNEDDPFYVE